MNRSHLVLRWLAAAFAILAGACASAVACLTLVSVAGRALWSRPISGDVELTQLGIAVAISLSLPWCQVQRANIIVDFFTQHLSETARSRLDGVGALLLGLTMALLTVRGLAGTASLRDAGETSIILELPAWWTYAGVLPGMALTALVALSQSIRALWPCREVEPS